MRRFLSMAVVRSMVRAVVALDGLGVGRELRHRRAERAEIVHHRLVDQHVAIGEIEDAFLAARLPQPPDDLKGGVGLAGAGRHDQQDAIPALGDGLDRGVDGIDLIVARGLVAAVVEIVLQDDLFGLRRQSLPGAIARPQIGRRRKGVEREVGFLGRRWRRCGRETRSRRRWRRIRRECRGSLRIPALAASRRRRCANCPWPRSARAECWA